MSFIGRCRQLLVALLGMVSMVAWAGNENIITFYITNSGITSTIGLKDQPNAGLRFSMDTSSNPELIGDPPSLSYNDSPLKFFKKFMDQYGEKFQQTVETSERKKLPTKVYIAAAGAMNAAEKEVPGLDKVGYYVQSLLGGETCHTTTKNKKDFFACMFALELERFLLSRPSVVIEEDAHLMATMASQYHDNNKEAAQPQGKSASDELLMVHTTTYAEPYRVAECSAMKPCNQQILPVPKGYGGIYQIGKIFKEDFVTPVLSSKELKELTELFERTRMGEIDQETFESGLNAIADIPAKHLVCATYSCPMLHKSYYRKVPGDAIAFNGAARMFYRLYRGPGLNVFGDKVRDVAFDVLPPGPEQTVSTLKFDLDKARSSAIDILQEANKSFLDVLLSFYYSEYSKSLEKEGSVAPQLVLVGEKIDLLERMASKKSTTVKQIFLTHLKQDDYVSNLWDMLHFSKITSMDLEKFKNWISSHAKPLIDNMLWIPAMELADYLHKGAIVRLGMNETGDTEPEET